MTEESTFLSPDEIEQLTDTPQKSRQAECLKRNGIPFYLSVTGRPKVARAVIEGRAGKSAPEKKAWVPAPLRGNHGSQAH